MAFSLKNGSTTHGVKVPEQHVVTDPVDLRESKSSLTISSIAKAAFVAFGTIGTYYLAKTTNVFSYIGWGSKNPKDINSNELVKVRNEKQSLIVRTNLEKVEESRSLFTTRRSYDDIVEFEEIEVEEFTIQEFDDLPEVKRREGGRRSITIQNSISNQTATIGELFELTINGATVFNSNTIFVEATDIPTWITSSSVNPTFIGSYDIPALGYAYDVVLLGNYAYVADRESGLQIIDISNPVNPTFIGSYDIPAPGYAYDVALSGNYAYVAALGSGLQIIDISDPANPTFIGSYNTPDSAIGIALSGNYAYVSDDLSGLQIIDISDPANPTFKGSYNTPDYAYGIAVSGNYAYVADWESGLQIIDISNPANPTFKGSYDTPSYAKDVALSGNYTYVADGVSGLQIIDITDPANPTFKGSYNTPGYSYGVALLGIHAYVADYYSGFLQIDTGLQIIDISDPTNPTFKGSYNTPGRANGIALSESYAYVADGGSGLQIISASLDKLTLSGTPSSVGTYSVDIEGCNELSECVTDSFNIIVTNPTTNPSDSTSTAIIISSSIVGTICAIGLCGGLSIIGGTIAFMRYRRKNVKKQQIVEIEPSLKEEQNVVKDTMQPVIQQQNPKVFPEAFVEYDLNSKGEKVPIAPDFGDDVELDTMPVNSKIPSAPELSEEFGEMEYDEEPPQNFLGPISQEIMQDPYILVATGQTYEKKQIMTWLSENDTDPLTRTKLTSIQIIPNIALRGSIGEWKEKHKIEKI